MCNGILYELKIVFVLLLAIVCVGCKDNGTGPSSATNLITNSTFERNGKPSLDGWHRWEESDTSVTEFSQDIPSGGGGFSITFQARQFSPCPSNSIYANLTVPSGNHLYRISIYGKRTGIGGAISVYVNRPPCELEREPFVIMPLTDTVWTLYSFSDTLSTISSDTVFIMLVGGATEVAGGTTYFNTCKFEKLD